MIDTLMALWNQDRRKRARQVILTFFLMCIGISLLFVIINRSAESQRQQTLSGQVNPTVPTFGNTVVPDITPTVSVVVGTQLTPGAIRPRSTPTVSTIPQSTPTVAAIQPTPIATTTQPCIATPSGATSQKSVLYINASVQRTSSPTPTPPRGNGTSDVPVKHFDGGGGGGPIDTGTPILPTATPMVQSTPSSGSQPGWVPNCTTSNSISFIARSSVLSLLLQNIWLILGSSLLGTMLFYSTLYAIKRRT